MPEKAVLAVVFMVANGKVFWQSVLTTQFATIPCHLKRTIAELKGLKSLSSRSVLVSPQLKFWNVHLLANLS